MNKIPPPRMRVAYILTPITFGGAEKVSLNFLRTVDRNRFDIHPILLIRPWEEENYFVSKLKCLGYTSIFVAVGTKPGGGPLRVVRVLYRFYTILKNGHFDLLHTHGYFADICGLPVAAMLGIPSVSTCHGFISNDRKLKVYEKLNTYVLRLCKRVIAVSESIKKELVDRGVMGSRIVVIPNSVVPASKPEECQDMRREKRCFLSIASDDFVVGYLGRLSEEKGLNYLVEAIAELTVAGILVKLLMVGEGPARMMLQKLVKTRGLENRVIFTGFQVDTENWLSAFDVFVLPSLTEGTPMALLEAMAMGLPVIATAVGDVPKVVTDGVNGLLVSPGDFRAIGKRIQMLQEKFELRTRLGKSGLCIVKEKFNIDSWCRDVEKHYLDFAS